MPGAKRCHPALPALLFLLLFSPGDVEGTRAASSSKSRARDLRALQGERRILLELLLRAVGDSQAPGIASSRKRLAGSRHLASSRHAVFTREFSMKDQFIKHFSDIFAKEPNVKDKILKFFTDPDSLPAECQMHFHRIYHNSRDCTDESLYQRCARMIVRLAMNPSCA